MVLKDVLFGLDETLEQEEGEEGLMGTGKVFSEDVKVFYSSYDDDDDKNSSLYIHI